MKLTVNTFLTLDGVMQGPGGADEDSSGGFIAGGWLIPHADPDLEQIVAGWYANADALLMGRSTYEMMQPYWEAVTDPQDRIASVLNQLPKYLATTTLTDPSWHNTQLLEGDVLAGVARIKAHGAGELQVHGSYRLVQDLQGAGMVDAYRLLIFPVVVGHGKRLFENNALAASFTVSRAETTRSGAISVTLHPAVLPGGSGTAH